MARTWIGLTWGEIKLLSLAGAGFLVDAYDLFVINMIYPLLLLAYYPPGTRNIEWGLSGGVLKASASMGNVVGQLLFGFLGDFWGRSVLYGKELMLAMAATVLIISAPDSIHGKGVTIWMAVFRFVLGLGLGADYPLSASVVADRSSLKTRGLLLSLIFSNQGWGALFAALAALAVIGGYKSAIEAGDLCQAEWSLAHFAGIAACTGSLCAVLSIDAGRVGEIRAGEVSAGPRRYRHACVGGGIGAGAQCKGRGGRYPTYERLHLDGRDQARQQATQDLAHAVVALVAAKLEWRFALQAAAADTVTAGSARGDAQGGCAEPGIRLPNHRCSAQRLLGVLWRVASPARAARHLALLVPRGHHLLRHQSQPVGPSLRSSGFLPGYYITVALVEVVGRKKIQLFGFAANAVLFLALALTYTHIIHHAAPFFVVFVLLQLSFNAGSNATTFIVPAEVFPTRIRATAHGFCAAMGKLGSIVSSLGFSVLANDERFGHTGIFWIFFGVSLLGLLVTVLLVPETKEYDADAVDRIELLDRARTA
ncbi:hypothetical protein L1887_49188 [Cichorium endivia]|nr:hypothetical protein L1887_49188 [Cichorium endivia]